MKIRKKCVRNGHRWPDYDVPVQLCMRYNCNGQRVNPDCQMPDELRAELERMVNLMMLGIEDPP